MEENLNRLQLSKFNISEKTVPVTEFNKNWRLIQLMTAIEQYNGVSFLYSKGCYTEFNKNCKNEVTYKNIYITNPLIQNSKIIKYTKLGNLVSSTLNIQKFPIAYESKIKTVYERFPINANFVAQWISEAIVSSKTYKLSLLCDRVIKSAKIGFNKIEGHENLKLVGIKIIISGRILGAEIATSKTFKAGQIPNNTIKILKDKGFALAKTRSGTIGIKVTYFWKVK